MATVHPSRMGLVPQDKKRSYQRRPRSPSPPNRYDRDRRVRDREREARDRESDSDSMRGDREREWDRSYNKRDRQRDGDNDRSRRMNSERRADDRERDRDRSRHRERERDGDRDRDKSGRASPEYGDYKHPPSPGPATPSMYPNRQQRGAMYERRGGYGAVGGGSEYLETRRTQRESSTFSIWPSSPKGPARALSPERGSSRRKSKRDRSGTPTDSSDSESERRRRERKTRKRARKEERRERKERRRRSRSYDTTEEERSRERHRDRRSKSESRPRSPNSSPPPSVSPASDNESEWVEKHVAAAPLFTTSQSNGSMPPPSTLPSHGAKQVEEDLDDDSDMELGPQPLMKATTSKRVDERAYGSALLRGEGSAMAAFLKDDTESRIPRRGEIGLTSGEIAQFEAVGYVMSGSRHKRMNAVRMRKENQVISAEEKRGILKLQKEERERREAILREEFNELVQEKLKGPETKRTVT